ncbi:hypothetical protein [Streptomyces caeruleatus]|uniref:Uncharacterized protein n=1 Tax=Streptomyces caeruleatus TaxID=661399 RepID=A0A101U3P1_9ACTN|nr:hypothetical protein [Streptomyces caeruleatus]KUO03414.1 hypothetical protein AQJ67_17035 [Streptomyces caeruleatus]
MSGIEAVLFLLACVGVVALVVWDRRGKARKRRQSEEASALLRSFAESRGWTYEEGVPSLVDAYEGAEPLPDRASNVTGDNVVSGTYRGFGFRAFEYRYYNKDVDSETTQVIVHSVWALNLGVDVPDLRIYRDGWFDTFYRGRAMEVGIPRLDKDFHIVSRDEERARPVVLGGLAEFLTSDPRALELPLRLHDGQLITSRSRTRLSGETFDEPLEYLVDAAGHLGSLSPARPPQAP